MVTYDAAEEIIAVLAKEISLGFPRRGSTLGDKAENFFKHRNTFGMFVIYDNGQCYAECIRWYRGEYTVKGELEVRLRPASLMYPDAALLLVRSP